MTLNDTLKIPSIRSRLDIWLKKQSCSGNQGFKNCYAIIQAEKIVIKLIENFNLSEEEAVKTVTDSMEGIINELYDIQSSNN